MTGGAIVRREDDDAVVLSVYGAFDGASAWALRLEMDASDATDFVVDLTHAEEACEFAPCLLAAWARENRRRKRIRFRPGEPEHVRLLVAFGLELDESWTEPDVLATTALVEGSRADGASAAAARAASVGDTAVLA